MDRLLHLWRRYTGGTPRRRALTDALVVAGIGTLVFALQPGPFFSAAPWRHSPDWWHLLLLAAGCAGMLAKFSAPALTLAGGTAIFTADVLIGGSLGTSLVLLDLLYTFALVGSAAAVRRVITAAGVVVAAAFAGSWLLTGELRVGVFLGLQSFAILGTPLWWGRSIRQQRELTELEAERAQDQLRLAAMRQEDALRGERERMARDLHDAVAGHLSAIALRSEAGLLHADAGSREGRSLAEVRRFSLAGLTEMRAMIQMLRGTTPERAAGRLGECEAREHLVHQHGATYQGPAGDLDLPTEIDQAAYRIAQESLTNATKHGRPPATLCLRHDPGELRVEVRNAVENSEQQPAAVVPGTGLGMAIMSERAQAVGGHFSAGMHDGGWCARAVLPIRDRDGNPSEEGGRW